MAQSITGTSLLESWQSTVAVPIARVTCDWNRDGDYGDLYEDVSARVLNLSIDQSLYQAYAGLPRMGENTTAQALVMLDNADNWFSPQNSSGLAGTYPGLADGIYRIPIKIELGYQSSGGAQEYLTQFVGEIVSANETEDAQRKIVTFRCEDKGYALSQYKYQSALLENYRTDQVIAAYLTAAGITDTDLDTGLFVIPYAYTETENLLAELGQVAASEGGLFYFSKTGLATFRRITCLQEREDSLTSQVTLGENAIYQYADDYSWRDAYTGVRVEWASLYLGAATEIYRQRAPLEIPPGGTATLKAIFLWPCEAYITPVSGTDYQPCLASGEQAVGVTMAVISESARELELQFTNPYASHSVYIVDLIIRGYPLLSEDEETIEEETGLTLVPGVKIFTIRGNFYLQTREQAEVISAYLRDWMQRPHRIYRWIGPGVPWIELLDRVHLEHASTPYNPGIDVDCYVLGMSQSFSPMEGYRGEMILLPVSNFYHYSDYFIIGTSTYADSGSDKLGY